MGKDGYIAIIILMGFFMFSCSYVKEKAYDVISQPDNFVEEFVEDVIEDQTGWDLDLTPFSPEE